MIGALENAILSRMIGYMNGVVDVITRDVAVILGATVLEEKNIEVVKIVLE